MLKIIKFVFLILFLAGIILAVYAFKSLTAKPEAKPTYAYPENDIKIEIPQEKRWFSDMKSTHKDFAYPATEVEFSINFLQDGYKKQKDQIVISNVDEETFFCLREILKEQNIHFAYRKTQDSLDIVLYLQDSQKDRLLGLFDYYAIHYSKN